MTDADTDAGIPGAHFLVLQPGVALDASTLTEAEVCAYGNADRNGDCRRSEPLVRVETYRVLIGADGYRPIAEDGPLVDPNIESPFELNITPLAAR